MSDEPKVDRKKAASASDGWVYVRVYWLREVDPVLGWVPKDWWERHVAGNRGDRLDLSPIPGAKPDMTICESAIFSIAALDWTTGERRECVKETNAPTER